MDFRRVIYASPQSFYGVFIDATAEQQLELLDDLKLNAPFAWDKVQEYCNFVCHNLLINNSKTTYSCEQQQMFLQHFWEILGADSVYVGYSVFNIIGHLDETAAKNLIDEHLMTIVKCDLLTIMYCPAATMIWPNDHLFIKHLSVNYAAWSNFIRDITRIKWSPCIISHILNVKFQDYYADTVLLQLFKQYDDETVYQILNGLVGLGQNLKDFRFRYGKDTLLTMACDRYMPKTVKFLVDAGSDVNVYICTSGLTPPMHLVNTALTTRFAEAKTIVGILKDAGADFSLKRPSSSQTAYAMAKQISHTVPSELQEEYREFCEALAYTPKPVCFTQNDVFYRCLVSIDETSVQVNTLSASGSEEYTTQCRRYMVHHIKHVYEVRIFATKTGDLIEIPM